jgi:hypothetical protein
LRRDERGTWESERQNYSKHEMFTAKASRTSSWVPVILRGVHVDFSNSVYRITAIDYSNKLHSFYMKFHFFISRKIRRNCQLRCSKNPLPTESWNELRQPGVRVLIDSKLWRMVAQRGVLEASNRTHILTFFFNSTFNLLFLALKYSYSLYLNLNTKLP